MPMRKLLLRSLSFACAVALVLACNPPEEINDDDTFGSQDSLKGGRPCKGNPNRQCDAGAPVVDAGPPPACESFTYSAYEPCQPNNTQARTVVTSSPPGCAGGTPDLVRACTY